jgi:[protein-PII] uridylyltransferase
VVDVYASDRPGLLFLVADAMFGLGLDIHLAKITTHLAAVLDVFYVTDAGRSKIEDPVRIAEIQRVIVAALDPEESQPVAIPA